MEYTLEECLEKCMNKTKKLYDCLIRDQKDIHSCLGGDLLSAYNNFIQCALEQTDQIKKEQEKIWTEVQTGL